MNQEIRKMFCDLLGEDRVFTEELMSQHTTFKIGGPADYFLVPEKSEDVGAIVRLCKKEGIPYFILGNGSNLLVGDGGYRGVVIQIYKNMSAVKTEGTTITAQAGALLSAVAAAAKNASLTGFEFAGGIPGTIGGAAVMNAGAYGGEMKDVLCEVTVMDKEGEIFSLPAEKLELGYRTSVIKKAGYIVLEAKIQLKEGDQEAIRETMKDLTIRRTTKQPLEYPSAGSTFKRPEGYFAGNLIMDSDVARAFADKLEDMIRFLIPNYIKEGKTSLVIGIGCTGGKHRSVTIARELYSRLSKAEDYGIRLEHRDAEKDRLLKK